MGSESWCDCCLPLCAGATITECIAKNDLCMPHCQNSAPCRRVLGVTTSFMFYTVSGGAGDHDGVATTLERDDLSASLTTIDSEQVCFLYIDIENCF